LGAGREKYFLPAVNTDYVFATVAEETGVAGSLLVMTVLGLVTYRALRIARRSQDRFAKLLAAGLGMAIGIQAVLNLAVLVNCVPATGVPLPFVSYGGSSVVILLAGIGILLNISRHCAAEAP
jgi:cell division protein FtsW